MPDDIYLGVKQIPNPKNIQVKSDTDAPDHEDDGSYAKMDMSNAPLTPPKMDNRLSQSTLTPHPLEKHVARAKTVRHQLGQHVPITVSEN